ncbi:MBL fold metallo-hydrolase [Oceanitalea stevensii]|uniref:MBL fold metallo-hydrolase n=1 Tax=Oceanitalea stevensii TaxID=2763072 RepID=A0ABR8Z1S6_9MICO|nr:MBL fold metallo-hydrolase [Oceanitalea stevensii]MBD8062287.1 MBL fold metallo-hydrolase [Oceanitalea stevensii]
MSDRSTILRDAADHVVCATCAVEHGRGPLPDVCVICDDERQWVPRSGQAWTTVGRLLEAGHRTVVEELEPGLLGIGTEPSVGIGQTGKLVVTDHGNVLFDVPGLIDDGAVAAIESRGGLAAIVASHPHMYGVQSLYSRAFADAPILVARADASFLPLHAPAVRLWDEAHDVLPGVRLEQIGGHFPGSTVALFTGADGSGVLLSGDGIFPGPEGRTVSFLRSYPNRIPLSAAVVRRIADQVAQLDFDRLYNNFRGVVPAGAGEVVERSAQRYVEWVSGEHDDLT